MDLKTVVKKIEEFAPKELAGSWDNVGLLIDPVADEPIKKIMLTNDLTEPVMKEAVENKVDFILSYHPPIFKPLKRLTANHWKERVVISCLVNKIALYSPHTSFDAAQGGVNDWLISPFGAGTVAPAEETEPGLGPGRTVKLEKPITLQEIIQITKSRLELDQVRLALPPSWCKGREVNSVAVCAGSGASVLSGCKWADVWVTGEMSHHEVLDAVHQETAVILCEHSNTERGYLKEYAKRLATDLDCDDVEIMISKADEDPLKIV